MQLKIEKNFLSISKKRINKNLFSFYHKNKRDLLWRSNCDPYYVMISEFMLQQTQVSRVAGYFNHFIAAFPTINALADASQKDVLKLWSGLGYNRRACYLHNAAKIIVDQYGGVIPINYKELLKIKGFGDYIAKAIVTYSYNIPHIFVETNIRSVFFILYKNFCFNYEKINDNVIALFLEKIIDKKNPREWYYAMMDFGAYLKKKYPNKHIQKSKHFTYQSKFEGSFRQLRGKILKFLLQSQKIVFFNDLKIEFNDSRLDCCINALLIDKFIEIKNNKILLRE